MVKRSLLVLSLFVFGGSVVGCTAKGRMHLGRSSAVKTTDTTDYGWSGASATDPSASAATTPSAPSVAPTTSTGAPAAIGDAPPVAAPPAPRAAGCELVCTDDHKNRVAKAASDAIANAISGELAALHGCTNDGPVPRLTLRFDSSSALTQFGVDDDQGGSCVDSVRTHRPAVTYQGPATLRCVEHCQR